MSEWIEDEVDILQKTAVEDQSVDDVMQGKLKSKKSEKRQNETATVKKSKHDSEEMIKFLLYVEKQEKIKRNPVLFTWWGNIAKCFLNCYRWRKGKMGRPNGCTCD